MRTRSDQGFTIMELVVVMTLALIIMGIALPNLLSWLPTYRLSAGARQVASDLQLARMKAISQNAKFRLDFGALPSTSYEFQKDENNNGVFEPPGETESGPFGLPDGITVTGVTATSVFQPRGTVNAISLITLQNVNSLTKQVQISIVGRVSIN